MYRTDSAVRRAAQTSDTLGTHTPTRHVLLMQAALLCGFKLRVIHKSVLTKFRVTGDSSFKLTAETRITHSKYQTRRYHCNTESSDSTTKQKVPSGLKPTWYMSRQVTMTR